MVAVKIFRATFLVAVLAAGCSTADKNKSELSADKGKKAPEVIGTQYTTIVFDKGKSSLTKSDKKLLNKLADKAHKDDRKIDQIRILAWADAEYPETKKKVAKEKDIVLASSRAQAIKDYLEEDLDEYEDIDSYNMARRPDFLSKLFHDDEFEVKEAFESSGATSTKLADGSVSYSKASKALVIIDYEGDEDNLK